ncbi:MAG TPA: hypothetical protein VNJ03_14950 [Vicinamibacterales bacterium]|nr:hypothetical protein [Vicinamibacterales bacterium]
MSVFTSRVTKSMTVSGLTVTYRKLSPKQLEGAGKASTMKSLQALKDIGGHAFLREIEDLGAKAQTVTPEVKAPEPAKPDPMMLFDRDYVLSKGILKWESDEAVPPLSDDAISDMDDDTADALARAILTLSKPSLFQSADEAEADRKNG